MYIESVPNRNSPPAILVRESVRIGARIVKRTVANVSHLPEHCIDVLRKALRGETLVEPSSAFDKIDDRFHGGCEAVRIAMRQIGFDSLLDSRRSRKRNLVIAMVVMRILNPKSKLATTRLWSAYTIAEDLGLSDADEQELYSAMDWLLAQQARIERKLAARHLHDGCHALYDLSSSYFEGGKCPLARRGYSRDGKPGKLQVNYGLLTDGLGCPVCISVFPGNATDSSTLPSQLTKLRDDFGLSSVVLVGDRGMICQKQIDSIAEQDGLAWITALRSQKVKHLVAEGAVQIGLFDDRNLFEITHPDYPNERLIACKNHELAHRRARIRESLLAATEAKLQKVKDAVVREKRPLRGAAKIALRIGREVNRHKVAKHFELDITDTTFEFRRKHQQISDEAALDGIYIVRTSLSSEQSSPADTVRDYKSLSRVERAFRTIKTTDLAIRPIHHRTEDRVRAHIFVCMLAYYVQWHMQRALQPMLFADEMTDEQKAQRDPVAAAKRSPTALDKVSTKKLNDGTAPHSFRTLLCDLSRIVRSTCRIRGTDTQGATFQITTSRSPPQQRVMELLAAIRPYPVR